MKKISIIEAVSSFFANDVTSDEKHKFHPEDIKVALNFIFNQIIYNTYLNGKKFSDLSQLDAWSRLYEVDIESQIGTEAYAFLPFPPYQLPDNAGIREIRDHDEPSNVFVPTEATSNPIFDELEVSTMDTTPSYHIEQSNVFVGAGEPTHILRMRQMPTGGDEIESVDILMIVGPEQIDDFDEIIIPANQEDTLVRQICDFLIKKSVDDTANDMVTENTPTQ